METVVALAILGVVAVAFLNGLTGVSKATFINDKQTTAESLARSQMEWVKNASYSYNATGYSPAPIPNSQDYINYSAVITAEPVHAADDGIQKITVTIKYFDKRIIQIEGYKTDR
jgi:type II secretory pathway pseudopilin PulG